ncbi:peptidylprolyl isomerase [Reinekea thalattae]|nr:peptidylprolyl isomerase [Reinekea thalattae]
MTKLFRSNATYRTHSLASQCFIAICALLFSATSQAVLLDRIIVVANDDVITAQELDNRLNFIKDQYRAAPNRLPDDESLKAQLLDTLILESLQLQLAKKSRIIIPDQTIDNTIASIAARQNMNVAQYYQQLNARGFSEQAIREQISNELTIAELQKQIISRQIYVSDAEVDRFLQTQSGQSFTETQYQLSYLRFDSSQRTQAEQLVAELNKGAKLIDQDNARDLGMRKLADIPSLFRTLVPVLNDNEAVIVERNGALHLAQLTNKSEVRSLNIKEYSIRHILIKTDIVFDDAAAQSLLEELRARILAGESMAELADEFSQDDGSKGLGGLLGWSRLDSYVSEFAEAALNTQQGELSEIFKSPFGFHILRVEGSRDRDVSIDVVRQQVRNQLGQQRYNDALERWQSELRAESFVEYR